MKLYNKSVFGNLARSVTTLVMLMLSSGFTPLPAEQNYSSQSSGSSTKFSSSEEIKNESSPQSPYILVQQRNCIRPSSNEYIYGDYKVGFSVGATYYESILSMRGDSGQMLTRYFNPNTNSPDMVLQTMRIYSCSFGLVIGGSNARNPNTGRPHPSYAPDNLVLRRQPNGEIILINCDAAKICASASIRKIRR